MRILDKYISSSYLIAFILSVLGLVTIMLLVDFIDRLNRYMDANVPTAILIEYYLNKTPFMLTFALPVSLMLACFFSIGGMTANRELIAMSSSGLSLYRTLTPVYFIGLMVFILSFLLSELLLPKTEKRHYEIYNEYVIQQKVREEQLNINIYLANPAGWIYYVKRYDYDTQTLNQITLTKRIKGTVIERIDASSGYWKNDTLCLVKGNIRKFNEAGLTEMASFDTIPIPELHEIPEDFEKERKPPQEMNIFELGQYIKKAKQSGVNTDELEVEWNFKISLPFANLIILMLGLPLSSIYRKSTFLAGFGLTSGFIFTYWFLMQFGRIWGRNGAIAPFWAAWGVNIIFLMTALVILIKIRK
jgi:lipopolysaccharide export system permease protein